MIVIDEGSFGSTSPNWVHSEIVPISGDKCVLLYIYSLLIMFLLHTDIDIAVRVRPASLRKCPRCWTFTRPEKQPLCGRCSVVVGWVEVAHCWSSNHLGTVRVKLKMMKAIQKTTRLRVRVRNVQDLSNVRVNQSTTFTDSNKGINCNTRHLKIGKGKRAPSRPATECVNFKRPLTTDMTPSAGLFLPRSESPRPTFWIPLYRLFCFCHSASYNSLFCKVGSILSADIPGHSLCTVNVTVAENQPFWLDRTPRQVYHKQTKWFYCRIQIPQFYLASLCGGRKLDEYAGCNGRM